MTKWLNDYQPQTIDIRQIMNEHLQDGYLKMMEQFTKQMNDDLEEIYAKIRENEINTKEN